MVGFHMISTMYLAAAATVITGVYYWSTQDKDNKEN